MSLWDNLSEQERQRRLDMQTLAEEDLYELSIKRYWETYDVAPDEAIPEQQILDKAVAHLTDAYAQWVEKLIESPRTPDWVHPLFALGPDKMADLTVRSLMLLTFRSSSWATAEDQYKDAFEYVPAQALARRIGETAVDIIRYQQAKKSNREDWLKVTHYVKRWTKARCLAFANKFARIQRGEFTAANREDFGHHMLRIAEKSGIIVIDTRRIKRGKSFRSVSSVRFCDEVVAEIMQGHDRCLDRCSILYRPMIVPPLEHTLTASGGHLNAWYRKSMVQDWTDDWATDTGIARGSEHSEVSLAGLNALQNTEWAVNERVLEVFENFFKNDTKLANLPAYSQAGWDFQEPFPEGGPKQAIAAWMEARFNEWTKWHKEQQYRLRILARIKMAHQLKRYGFFYHVYTCDFRGRAYSVCELLSPQGSDFDRGLIQFANPVEQTEEGMYWLKVHVANLFDMDKCPFDERVAWVDENMAMFEAINEDPYEHKHLWVSDKKKKNPSFQRLAAVIDLCRKDGLTQCPVQMDGTCNGSQHWAAIMRDPELAFHVNVVPTDKPEDLYQVVADAATAIIRDPEDAGHYWKERFAAHWPDGVPRSVTKRVTMCDSYGLTFYGIRKYMRVEEHVSHEWVAPEEMAGAVQELALVLDGSLKVCWSTPT